MDADIMSCAARVVAARLTHNDVPLDQLPGLIRGVHDALATAGKSEAKPVEAEPAVQVKKSHFSDHLVCLDCGQSYTMLKRHIATDHGLSPEEYRTKWHLPPTYPMVATEYAETRSRLAKESGLGKRKTRPARSAVVPASAPRKNAASTAPWGRKKKRA